MTGQMDVMGVMMMESMVTDMHEMEPPAEKTRGQEEEARAQKLGLKTSEGQGWTHV
jgi:hypothetical protein